MHSLTMNKNSNDGKVVDDSLYEEDHDVVNSTNCA